MKYQLATKLIDIRPVMRDVKANKWIASVYSNGARLATSDVLFDSLEDANKSIAELQRIITTNGGIEVGQIGIRPTRGNK